MLSSGRALFGDLEYLIEEFGSGRSMVLDGDCC